MKDKNKSTKESPKSLLKWKLNSIGVLNIGAQCQSKDRDKIRKTETSSETHTHTHTTHTQKDERPPQKSVQLWLAKYFLINFLNRLKSWISLISFGKEFQWWMALL